MSIPPAFLSVDVVVDGLAWDSTGLCNVDVVANLCILPLNLFALPSLILARPFVM